MKKLGKIIESITHRGVQTICHPRSILNGHIAVSTSPPNYFKAFLVDRDNVKVTESGGLMVKLPPKSNIRDIEKPLDKITKERGGYRGALTKSRPKRNQKSWIDPFNRYMATKNETQDGISYLLRADIANDISQRGKLLVQCDESFCDILVPTKLSVDLNKYSVAMDEDEVDA